MASLTGQTVSSTYDGLLKTDDNDILGASPKEITDGLGNGTGMTLTTTGDVGIAGDLTVDGAILDSNGVPGTSGQVLSSTVTGTDWIDVAGAVDSVNGEIGVVTLDIDNITDQGATTTNALTIGGLHVDSTGSIEMPTGTTGERPTAVTGMLRFNTTDSSFEGYDGTEWGAIGGGATNVVDNFSGDGSTVAFTLANSVANENDTNIYISGVYQSKGNYTVSGTTLTFSTAPPNGTSVEVMSAIS